MSYIGSNPITQYFGSGTDLFSVGATPQSVFTLTRPVSTVNDIEILIGASGELPPSTTNYTVNRTTLTLNTPISNTTMYVRYLSTSTFTVVPSPGTVNIASLSVGGTPNFNNALLGNATWGSIGIPISNVPTTGAYTWAQSENGYVVRKTDGSTITVPANTISPGVTTVFVNDSPFNQTIAPDPAVTLRLAGSNTTGNRMLSMYGVCTVWCLDVNLFWVNGQGLT